MSGCSASTSTAFTTVVRDPRPRGDLSLRHTLCRQPPGHRHDCPIFNRRRHDPFRQADRHRRPSQGKTPGSDSRDHRDERKGAEYLADPQTLGWVFHPSVCGVDRRVCGRPGPVPSARGIMRHRSTWDAIQHWSPRCIRAGRPQLPKTEPTVRPPLSPPPDVGAERVIAPLEGSRTTLSQLAGSVTPGALRNPRTG